MFRASSKIKYKVWQIVWSYKLDNYTPATSAVKSRPIVPFVANLSELLLHILSHVLSVYVTYLIYIYNGFNTCS